MHSAVGRTLFTHYLPSVGALRLRKLTLCLTDLQQQQQQRDGSDTLTKFHSERKVSKAMLAYREKVKQHDAFMAKQFSEFDIGKRHLANMMGEDSDSLTQRDVDRYIRYLFPCGIFEKKARPKMKHPSEIFPRQEEAKFDVQGRPHHFLFYTLRPHLNELLHEISSKLENLDALENRMLMRGEKPDPSQAIVLHGSDWLKDSEIGAKLMEALTPKQYDQLTRALTRLAIHNLSYHEKQFIFEYRTMATARTKSMTIPDLVFDENDRPYMEAKGVRKYCRAQVRVTGRGSGEFTVNGRPAVNFFLIPRLRTGMLEMKQLMLPLQVVNMLDCVDVTAEVTYKGERYEIACESPSAQAGAIRHALSLALRSFVDKHMVETMRLAGLLTRDPRTRERKKTGKLGARRARTWKKR